MNEATGLCRGCYRTLDEIARWGGMGDAERGRVMAELPERRPSLDVAEAPPSPISRE